MKLVMEVPNGFGKIVNGEPIILCFGSYIYKTHNYALFGDKAKVLLSDIDWLQQPGSIEQKQEPKIDEIKVGDEVIVQDNIVGFVTEIDSSSGEIHVTTEHGWSDVFHKNFVKKTGRYFPNVAAILMRISQMKAKEEKSNETISKSNDQR